MARAATRSARGRLGAGGRLQVAQGDQPDIDDEQQAQQQAGQDAGHEQPANGLLGQDGVKDEAGRGRSSLMSRITLEITMQ